MRAKRFRYKGASAGESYLRAAARRAMNKILQIKAMVEEMRAFADANPFRPGVSDILQFSRSIEVDGRKLRVAIVRTVAGNRHFYQFSLGNNSGMPASIPAATVRRVREAFLPNGIMVPGTIGNCYQWVEEI